MPGGRDVTGMVLHGVWQKQYEGSALGHHGVEDAGQILCMRLLPGATLQVGSEARIDPACLQDRRGDDGSAGRSGR